MNERGRVSIQIPEKMNEWRQRIKRAKETGGTHVTELRRQIEESVDLITSAYIAVGTDYVETEVDPNSLKELFLRSGTIARMYEKSEAFSRCLMGTLKQQDGMSLQRVVTIVMEPTGYTGKSRLLGSLILQEGKSARSLEIGEVIGEEDGYWRTTPIEKWQARARDLEPINSQLLTIRNAVRP